MENQQLTQLIRRELPGILQRDREMREWVLALTRERYADKGETESRFDRVLDELRRDREENTRKWEENQQELRVMREEQNRKWEENQQELRVMREEQNRKWEANQQELRAMREEQNRKWEKQNRKWDEQNRKWEANQQELKAMREEATRHFDRVYARLDEQRDRLARSIGALGARWGMQTESSFRNALAGILEESFGVEVRNETLRDDAGEVFGRPDQVELDVIIQNGMLILCEIKSLISRSEMHTFARKAAFYEKRCGRKATRKLVISPMVDAQARALATELGIEVYSDAEDVTLSSTDRPGGVGSA